MKAIDYIKDTRGELKHVTWLSRNQAIVYTLLVIAVSIGVAVFLSLFDYSFTYLLETFILK